MASHLKQSSSSKNALKAYNLPLKGLQKKEKVFQFLIDKNFFQLFEDVPSQDCKITVQLTVEKRTNLYQLNFNFDGIINVECDRCMELFAFQFQFQPVILLQQHHVRSYSDQVEETPDSEDSDIIYISPESTTYNVAQLIYEFLILGMPMQKVHPTDADTGKPLCDPKVLAILNNVYEQDVIEEDKSTQNETEGEEEAPIDPRWAALKQLKNRKN